MIVSTGGYTTTGGFPELFGEAAWAIIEAVFRPMALSRVPPLADRRGDEAE